jgi:outer membrane lipoprotein-sorting protein
MAFRLWNRTRGAFRRLRAVKETMRLQVPGVVLFCALPLAWGQTPTLEAVFQRMDSAAASFKGLTANVKRVDHQDIINADTEGVGTIAFRKLKKGETQFLMTTRYLDPPKQETVSLDKDLLTIFHPAIKTANIAKLSNSTKNKAEQFLALGFGTTSAELKANYAVTLGGPETVDGQKTTRLDLVPKSQEVLQTYKKIFMWISDSTGIALQLKLIQPGLRDYNVATYSNIQLGPVSDGQIKLELPKDVKREPLR